MLILASFLDSSISGIVPAFGVVIGGAVVGLVRAKRIERAQNRKEDAATDKSIHDRLSVVEDLISGTDPVMIGNRVVTPGTAGLGDRFTSLEGQVGTLVVSVDRLSRIVENGNGKAH